MVKAVVLEERDKLSLRDIKVEETLGRRDVRIGLRNIGICGSDVHYYTHGKIGPFEVRAPMILGHEASGVILEVGADVTELKEGDRVFIGTIVFVALHLLWMRFLEAHIPLYVATALSLLIGAIIVARG